MNATPEGPPVDTPMLVLGTGNRKKGLELAELLVPLGIFVRTLADFPNAISIDECGTSFAENATLKATLQAARLKRWVLGDDSGLAVDALGGGPGIHSARFAGPDASDADNRRRLLEELSGVALDRRAAHFVCHLVLADPDGTVRAQTTGRCHGRIRFEESGTGGFGYDSLFEIIEYHRTFGDLSSTTKACLSHRARAIQALVTRLTALLPLLRSSSLIPNT
jgi:XTP/dITP diphosphohydrolase